MANSSPDVPSYIVPIDRANSVCISRVEWGGVVYADVRHIFHAGDGRDYPTRRGVRVPPEKLGEIAEATRRLHEQLAGGAH